jgi:hypothetical protein
VLVAYVTPDFPASRWTEQEVGWALGRGAPVVPVNVGLQPYGFFGALQSLPGEGRSAWDLAYSVFHAIVLSFLRLGTPDSSSTPPIVARTVVRAFCESPSYESTRQRFSLLKLIPKSQWTREMTTDLERAAVDNNQISEAGLRTRPPIAVPEAIKVLTAGLGV